jgi:hypothetical protein
MLTKFHYITNLKKCLQVGFRTFYRASESSSFYRSPCPGPKMITPPLTLSPICFRKSLPFHPLPHRKLWRESIQLAQKHKNGYGSVPRRRRGTKIILQHKNSTLRRHCVLLMQIFLRPYSVLHSILAVKRTLKPSAATFPLAPEYKCLLTENAAAFTIL